MKFVYRFVALSFAGLILSSCHSSPATTSLAQTTTSTGGSGVDIPVNQVKSYLYSTISVKMQVESYQTDGWNADTYIFPVQNPGQDPTLNWSGFEVILTQSAITFSVNAQLGQSLVFTGEVLPDGSGGVSMLDPTITGIAQPVPIALPSTFVIGPGEAANYIGDTVTVQMTVLGVGDLIAQDGADWIDSSASCGAGCTAFDVELNGSHTISDGKLNSLMNKVVDFHGTIEESYGQPAMLNPIFQIPSTLTTTTTSPNGTFAPCLAVSSESLKLLGNAVLGEMSSAIVSRISIKPDANCLTSLSIRAHDPRDPSWVVYVVTNHDHSTTSLGGFVGLAHQVNQRWLVLLGPGSSCNPTLDGFNAVLKELPTAVLKWYTPSCEHS